MGYKMEDRVMDGRKNLFLNLSLLGCALLICFSIGEIGIRCIGHTDADGNFFVRERKLRPYHLPLRTTQSKIESYLQSSTPFIIYDSILGWKPRSSSVSANGLYAYNAMGIRSPEEYTERPLPNVLRIAIFGDSFTHGDDVSYENTWGYYLQQKLAQRGIHAEVLNFGVGGYGIDQAFLQWQTFGKKFNPRIVIFGFQAENILRDVNCFRTIYYVTSGIPFAKPRFIINQGRLELTNVPTPRPEQVVQAIRTVATSGLRESFYIPADYRETIWYKSRLVSFIESFLTVNPSRFRQHYIDQYMIDKEPGQLALWIIKAFRDEAEQSHQKFAVLNLPQGRDLISLVQDNFYTYSGLLKALQDKQIALIDPAPELRAMVARASIDAIQKNHYTSLGNAVIADAVLRYFEENPSWYK
jgi:hypothetical protein